MQVKMKEKLLKIKILRLKLWKIVLKVENLLFLSKCFKKVMNSKIKLVYLQYYLERK